MIEIILDIADYLQVMNLDTEKLGSNYPAKFKKQDFQNYLSSTKRYPPDVEYKKIGGYPLPYQDLPFLEHKDIYFFSTKSTEANGFIDAPTLFKEGIIKFHNYKGIFETPKSRGVNLIIEKYLWYPIKFISEVTGLSIDKINSDAKSEKILRHVPNTPLITTNRFNGESLNDLYGPKEIL